MKRCPQCYQVYANTETFCEADGERLLADPALVVNADLVPYVPVRQPNQAVLATGIIGVLTGVILCAGAYAAYLFFNSPSNRDERERPPFAQVHEPAPARPAPARVNEAVPSPSETPTEEEEAEASPEPSPQQSPAESVFARLNQGPVSTGDQASAAPDAKVKTIVEMQDGSTLEVDAAWKDSQGVWYRQGSLVSFVEASRVKAITARAETKASAAGNQ